MRHEDLRVLLKIGGHGDNRNVAALGQKIAEEVAGLEEVELAGKKEHPAVPLRTARPNGDVEPVFGVGAVDDGLVVAARFRVREPVQAEGDLVQRESRASRSDKGCKRGESNR